ncbi:the G-protein coupled receptor 2 [Porites harrisoni]
MLYWRRWIILITTAFTITGVLAFGANMRNIRSKYVCENDVMHLSCTSPKVLKIHGADYGGSEVSVCGEGKASNVSCKVIDRTGKIKFVCDNKSSCSLVAMTRIFGDPCPSSSKYLNVIYACVKPSDAATTPQSSIATTKGLNASAMNLTTSTNTTQPSSTEPSEKNIHAHVLTTRPDKKTAKTQKFVPVFDPSNNFDLEPIFDSAQGIKCSTGGIFLLVFMTFAISFLRL